MAEFNARLSLYRGVPVDESYEHVFAHDSRANFYNFLRGNFSYKDYTYLSYIRPGVIRVYSGSEGSFTTSADFLKTFNYLSFQNMTNYADEQTLVFGFIDDVIYINDDTAEIYYTIDVFHTWFSKLTLGECFILRQHAAVDNFGDNLQPEPVSIGADYIYSGHIKDQIINQMMYVLVTNEGAGDATSQDGIYSPSKYYLFHTDADGVQALNDTIQRFDITPQKIVNLYVAPAFVLGWEGDNPVMNAFSNGTEPKNALGAFQESKTRTVTHATAQQVLSGLQLQNQKTFTSPYCLFNVNNASGQDMDLKYEYFTNGTPKLSFLSTYVAPVKILCKPNDYKAIGAIDLQGEGITLDNYPVCAFENDAYMNWLINSGVPIVAGGALAQTGGANPGGAVNAASSFAQGAFTASMQAPITKGNLNSGNVNVSHGNQTFFTACKHLPGEVLKKIDSYFTRYGYAQNKIAIPNLYARTYYTYIQTADCCIHGNATAAVINQIKNIFNKGVTVWKQTAITRFGDFSQNPLNP